MQYILALEQGGYCMFYIDGHCDSLCKALDEKIELNDNRLQFNFKKAKEKARKLYHMC